MKGEVKEADLSSLSREVLTGVNSPRGQTPGNTQGQVWGGFQEQPGSYLANLQHMGECAQAGQLPRGVAVSGVCGYVSGGVCGCVSGGVCVWVWVYLGAVFVWVCLSTQWFILLLSIPGQLIRNQEAKVNVFPWLPPVPSHRQIRSLGRSSSL